MIIEEVDDTNILVTDDDVVQFGNMDALSISMNDFDSVIILAISKIQGLLARYLTEKQITIDYSVRSLSRGRIVRGGAINSIVSLSDEDGNVLDTDDYKLAGDELLYSGLIETGFITVVYTTGYKKDEIPVEITSWILKLCVHEFTIRFDSDDENNKTKDRAIMNECKIGLMDFRSPYQI